MVLNWPLLLSSGLFSLLERFKAVEKPPTINGLKLLMRLVEIFNNKGKCMYVDLTSRIKSD